MAEKEGATQDILSFVLRVAALYATIKICSRRFCRIMIATRRRDYFGHPGLRLSARCTAWQRSIRSRRISRTM